MDYERRRDTVAAYVTGELDQCSAQGIRRELDQMIEGFSVMQTFMDDVRVESSPGCGTTVRMKKRLENNA